MLLGIQVFNSGSLKNAGQASLQKSAYSKLSDMLWPLYVKPADMFLIQSIPIPFI